MKRLAALTFGGILSVFLAAAVNAAPATTAVNPQQQQGLKNAKKTMQGKLAQDKKMDEIRNKGQQQKKHSQKNKHLKHFTAEMHN